MQNGDKEEVASRLRKRFGELMTTDETAEILRRSAPSLKVTLASVGRRNQQWARMLIDGRVRIGRRVLFRVDAVASVIIYGDDGGGE